MSRKNPRLLHAFDPVIQNKWLDCRWIVTFLFDKHLPELPLSASDQHLWDVRYPEKAQVLPVDQSDPTRRWICLGLTQHHTPSIRNWAVTFIFGPDVTYFQAKAAENHLAEAQLDYTISIKCSYSICVFRTSIFAVQLESRMAKLRHYLRDVTCLLLACVTIGRGRCVCIAKATKIGSHDSELWSQQGEDTIPIEAILWCS